jgi:isopentenyl-diphosphate delta-isomerase
VLDGGVPALVSLISAWLDQLQALMTALGARTPAELTRCDVLIQGGLWAYCAERGIPTAPLAHRSTSHRISHEAIGGTR